MNAILVFEQLLNGAGYGLMLFLIAAGLTLVFGVMDVLNLSHGSLFMVGAYVAAQVHVQSGSFALAVGVAVVVTAAVAALLEVTLMRRLYGRDHLAQVLATFGVILVADDAVKMIWGPSPVMASAPAALAGPVELFAGLPYPSYRLLVLGAGVLVALLLYLLVNHSRVGMLVRAGASNRWMAELMGVRVTRIFSGIFVLALGLAALAGALWIDLPLDAVMIQLASGINKFSLLAIPFFVLAGAIMAEGGMARRLVAFAGVLVGFIRGGLSLVNILASTFFGAISGSSVADTASVGSVLIPEMEKKGYPRDFAAAVTVSGSVQAILIPPSHNAVLYSLAAGGSVSIAALFMAGVLPGLLMGLTLAALCLITARRRNYPKGEVIALKQALKITVDALWGLMTMVIILGGILSGVFTANESASIAVLWAFFVTMFIYRDYKWRDLPRLVHRTVKTVTVVMILIGFAAAFGYLMTLMMIPMKVTAFITSLSDNKYVILGLINLLLMLLGCLMDMSPLILILTPILLPVATSLGIDPVHFGMIMMVNLGIGLITPPVGTVLFVGSAVAKLSLGVVTRAMMPFFIALFIVLLMVTYMPWLSLWLPRLLGL